MTHRIKRIAVFAFLILIAGGIGSVLGIIFSADGLGSLSKTAEQEPDVSESFLRWWRGESVTDEVIIEKPMQPPKNRGQTPVDQQPETTSVSDRPVETDDFYETSRKLFLRARYADGRELVGRTFRIRVGDADRTLKSTTGLTPLGRFRYGQEIKLNIGQNDVAYQSSIERVFSADEADRTEIFDVMFMPATEFQSGVSVDLTAYPKHETFEIVVATAGMRTISGNVGGGKFWQSSIMLRDLGVVVTVSGAIDWTSDEVLLVDGERTVLKPVHLEPGSVLVRVNVPVGMTGTKVLCTNSKSVMMRWEEYLKLDYGTDMGPQYAISDEKGVICIKGIRPGTREFSLVGKGLEATTVKCEVISETQTDAGTVVMVEKK
ncbi:MAG: hypothetical protein ACYTDT_12585 [Planctomycetota bacterium]|jgi:hypothetical protein